MWAPRGAGVASKPQRKTGLSPGLSFAASEGGPRGRALARVRARWGKNAIGEVAGPEGRRARRVAMRTRERRSRSPRLPSVLDHGGPDRARELARRGAVPGPPTRG